MNRINPDNWTPDPQKPKRSFVHLASRRGAAREGILQESVNTDETRDFNIHGHLHYRRGEPRTCHARVR